MARRQLQEEPFQRAMQVTEIPQGSTASWLEYTFKTDGVADDLSSASGSLYFSAKTPSGDAVVVDQSASWTTDGSDGKIRTQMNATLVNSARDLYYEFEVQGFGGGNLISKIEILRITPRAKVS